VTYETIDRAATTWRGAVERAAGLLPCERYSNQYASGPTEGRRAGALCSLPPTCVNSGQQRPAELALLDRVRHCPRGESVTQHLITL